MWTLLLISPLIAVAVQAKATAWKSNTQYKYAVRGRTLTALHQVAGQYTGMVMKASVIVQEKSDSIVSVQLNSAEYADVHTNLSQGWWSPVPDNLLHFQKIPLTNKPFELKYKNGAIVAMVVSKNLPTWELNMLKGIASQLQVDTRAENHQKFRISSLPNKENVNGVYKIMEDSVDGQCETLYNVSQLPKVVFEKEPQLAPMPHLQADGQLIDIVKTRNFSKCDIHPDYHLGITRLTSWGPASNQMEQFLSRSSVSRVVISGNLENYTIQSSVTTNKIIARPFLFDKQNSIVFSHMNLTLVDVKSAIGSPQSPLNPQIMKNLVYEFNPASSENNNQQRPDLQYNENDSSSTQPEGKDQYNNGKRSRFSRSIEQSHNEDNQFKNRNSKGQNNWNNEEIISKQKNNISNNSAESLEYYNDNISYSSFFSDSSEEDSWQPKTDLSKAPRIPFLPEFVGIQGNNIQSSKEINGIAIVENIALQISQEMQAPSAIPGQNTLSKFTLMVEILRTMNAKQMEEATKELFFPLSSASSSSSSDALKYQAWAAFRDAVAQAGTGPALLTMKEWIQSKKVQGDEAAQLIAVLSNAACFPNMEYMSTFFALATSSEVQHQQFLNTSAILSFTDLARKAFVSKHSYNRFPVHVFGALKKKNEEPVVQQYIPYFAQALKQAVMQADSIKIRTLTVALGSLAHPRILQVFEPYLEGKQPMTHFQRLTVVMSLSKMAKIFPEVARPVLYRIYQNTGEATELRVAAVFQIIRTNPPAHILQLMARFTNDDQDPQVISAVQSAIKSAAENMQSPQHRELQMNAQSAVNLLNPKEQPVQFSKRYMRSGLARDLSFAYKQSLSYIGSDDSYLPSNIFYSLRHNVGGLNIKSAGMGAMTSSLDDLVNLTQEQFADTSSSSSGHSHRQEQGSSSDSKWSFDKIDNMLNIQKLEQEQVEAQLHMHVLGGKRFFAFDNNTVKMMPEMVKSAAASLRSGQNFNYTKIVNRLSMTVAFPTAMGLPFVFSLKTPTLLYISGHVRATSRPDLTRGHGYKIQLPRTVNASVDIRIVQSTQAQSQIGFVAPFNNQHYFARVNRNIQINIPIGAEIDFDTVHYNVTAKISPLDYHSKQNMFEFSTEPYTCKIDIVKLAQNQDISDETNKKIVYSHRPIQMSKTIGLDSTGLVFDFDYHSEQKFFHFASIFKYFKHQDPMSAILYTWVEDSINVKNITLAFNPQKSTAKHVRLSAAYFHKSVDENNNQNSDSVNKNYRKSDQSEENYNGPSDSQRAYPDDRLSTNMTKHFSPDPGSKRRQQEFLQRVGQGIQDSVNFVVDLAAEFEGRTNSQYVATLAVASGNVSTTSRLLFFAEKTPAQISNNNKRAQIFAAAEFSVPNVPLMNFNKALNTDPISYFNAEVAFGDKSSELAHVHFQGKMQRSQARRQYLEQSLLANQCKRQMQEGNTIQYACRQVTFQANLMDQYTLHIYYDKISASLKNATYKAYAALHNAGYQYLNEDLISANNPSNQIQVEANFSPDLKSVNVSVESPQMTTEFNNVLLNRYVTPLVVMSPEYSLLQIYALEPFKGQHFPTCAIDKNQAQTFDNKSYPIKLGMCWHTMFHHSPKDDGISNRASDEGDDQEISVLVRDTSSSEKELMVVIRDNTIHLQPTARNILINVKVNGEQTQVSNNRLTTLKDQDGETYAQMYATSAGEIRLYTPQQNIEVQYDGTAVKLKAQNSYRSKVRGLCGTFNTKPEDDFTTPHNCVLQNPFEFAASYALDSSSCEASAKELNQRAQQKVSNGQCFRDVVIYSNVVTDEESPNFRHKFYFNRKYLKGRKYRDQNEKYTQCSMKRSQVIERDGKDCFSVQPQLVCSDDCKPQSSVGKQVEFVCLQPSSTTHHFKSMINRGTNPDLSQEKVVHSFWINVPEGCKN